MQEDNLRKQEESVQKQEAIRRSKTGKDVGSNENSVVHDYSRDDWARGGTKAQKWDVAHGVQDEGQVRLCWVNDFRVNFFFAVELLSEQS